MRNHANFNVSLHSIIDIITNSSTEIFTTAKESAPQGIKDFIDSILIASGSTLRHQDLFHDIIRFDATEIADLDKIIFDMILDGEYDPSVDNFKYISEQEYNYITSDKCQSFKFNFDKLLFIYEHQELFEAEIDNNNNPCTLLFFPKETINVELYKKISQISSLFTSEEFYC